MSTRGLTQRLPGRTAIGGLGLGLVTLFIGSAWFWMVLVLRFAIVAPLVAILSAALVEPPTDQPAALPAEGTVAVPRDRYARGEIDEGALGRRLERLLETGTVEAARDRIDAGERAAEVERA